MARNRIFWTGLAFAAAAVVNAQSFNIDMDTPGLGGGAPSPSFGGAGSSPGYWNKIYAPGFGTNALRGLDGNLTSARIVGPEGGGGGGHNIPINTGDYALLLNDARSVGWITSLQFKFDGLQNGLYKIYTYAVSLSLLTGTHRTRVTVDESIGSAALISSGPMPGNAF